MLAQFKNYKQFSNLAHHESDFGSSATWIFSASGHGKGVVDGIGGYLKERAANDSKVSKEGFMSSITDAKGFHDFIIRKKFKTIPLLVTTEEIDKTALTLEERWKNASTIKGTQKFHHYEVDKTDSNFLFVKYFSTSNYTKRVRIIKKIVMEILLSLYKSLLNCSILTFDVF